MNINEIYQLFKNANKICTDTRKLEENDLFFALKGDNFNGNKFAGQAIEAGAAYAIIDEKEYETHTQCILVDDVLDTLQKLAHHHRKTFNIPVISLTGSNGKTTNKELLKAALSTRYKVHATAGNLNNHIGVPLTLLSMPVDTEIAIIEMGANHQKEIEQLCRIAEPNHGFITNVGKAHLEGFGGIDGIKKGKGELYDYLKSAGGHVFVNEKDAVLLQMVQERKLNQVVFYGNDEKALRILTETPEITFQEPKEHKKYQGYISGGYNFENMQTAYAIARFFGVPADVACKALAAYNPDNNRSQKIEKASNIIFLDAYNANPSSMQASIMNFSRLQTTQKKVVFLGEMYELGEYSASEHEALGKLIADSGFDEVILYGEQMKHALVHVPQAYFFTDKFSLHNWVADKKFKNSAILIKASRGVGLETVVGVL